MPDYKLPVIDPAAQFQSYIQRRGQERRASDELPTSRAAWLARKQDLRRTLLQTWGGFPETPCDLTPQVLGELKRDGYRVEKIIFQTLPGLYMTANAYVPEGAERRPAVLCVHGHWAGAKQDPVVQSRCIGLAKLGFFVLVVDAVGAGERGITKKLGQYHGEMTAATLWPIGRPLSGLQVYENMRAVDYLQTRPEVDANRIGITGASGGGNQSMYAGAFDERFKCVVPVCSVGTYQAYLSAACCLCEVVPGAMRHTEEWGILSLVAPRALMVINATRDAFQFSIGEAEKSITAARTVFNLFDVPDKLRHSTFESPHAYNQPMREAMYGWMTLHLKGEGNGAPIPEPKIDVEEPETLRCYPGETRPDTIITIPQFAATEGRRLVDRLNGQKYEHREHWEATVMGWQHAFSRNVLGADPRLLEQRPHVQKADDGSRTITIETEPGLQITVKHRPGRLNNRRAVLLLDLQGSEQAEQSPQAAAFRDAGWDLLTVDLRDTGRYAVPRNAVGAAPDHHSAEWSVWTGRPLLGQWIWDVRTVLNVLQELHPELMRGLALVGLGSAGVVAIGTGVLDHRVHRFAAVRSLVSYVTDRPYVDQRLGIMAPRIVAEVGDIPHLAAMIAPRQLVIAGGVNGAGETLPEADLNTQFDFTKNMYELLEAPARLSIVSADKPAALVEQLTAAL